MAGEREKVEMRLGDDGGDVRIAPRMYRKIHFLRRYFLFPCFPRLFRLFAIRLTASQLALIFRIFASLVFFIRSGLSFKDFVSLRSSQRDPGCEMKQNERKEEDAFQNTRSDGGKNIDMSMFSSFQKTF